MKPVPVVDLFAGAGGLGEGFAACQRPDGRPRYRVCLSVESHRDAVKTLRLRTFLRRFPSGFPSEYYAFLNGETAAEPDWARLYARRWAAACDDVRQLELGTLEADQFLRQRIRRIREEHGGRTVLLGGPPCQVYSVIGRSRISAEAGYDPASDVRQSLYEQYAQVLERLRPAVAVMENVKGLLSARLNGRPLFPTVLGRLRDAGGKNAYRLFGLSSGSGSGSSGENVTPEDFLVAAEEHRVPQARHRVFVVCVRSDLAAEIGDDSMPRLEPTGARVPFGAVVPSAPRLRSRLSRRDDPCSWQDAVRAARQQIAASLHGMAPDAQQRFRMALDKTLATTTGSAPPCRGSRGRVGLPAKCPDDLREWLLDPNLRMLPNHETRGHMPSDLGRYLFAAAFACAFRRSPRTADFPKEIAASHTNWHSGAFSDRYRVQTPHRPSTTVTSHLSKDGHYYIHPDPAQCRSLTVREAARLQTFPDNYFFQGGRTQQYVQVGNAVPPFLARQIADALARLLRRHDRVGPRRGHTAVSSYRPLPATGRLSASVAARGF